MPQTILSKNSKCGHSINLPIKGHCRPTKACSFCCYARTGRTTLPESIAKQTWVSNYLTGNDLSRLIKECRKLNHVRLNGTGDLNKEHVPALLSLASLVPDTQFWGMTRKTDIAMAINGRLPNLKLLVSVDATSPPSAWNYPGKLCYGPRRPEDTVPDDPRIVTVFPRHFAGRVIKAVPHHPKDCQGVWHTISGCNECGRCWNWS